MVLTKREKYIAIASIAGLTILVLNFAVYDPLVQQLDAIDAQRLTATKKMDDALNVFEQQRQLNPVWKEMKASGLKSDSNEAESQAQHAIDDWAQFSGVVLTSLKRERANSEDKFTVSSYHVTARGPMPAVSRFLAFFEMSPIPMRINDMQISALKEGTDNLSIQMTVSTLCTTSDPKTMASGSASVEGRS
jgi:hypothetical protein